MLFAIGGLTRFAEEPSKFKTRAYSADEKRKILEYMTSVEPNSAGGYIDDCKKGIETTIPDIGYDDGVYQWSQQDIYHIEKYNAAVNEEFLRHIKQKMAT